MTENAATPEQIEEAAKEVWRITNGVLGERFQEERPDQWITLTIEEEREQFREAGRAVLEAAACTSPPLAESQNVTTRVLLTEVSFRMKHRQNSFRGRELADLCDAALQNLATGILDYAAPVAVPDPKEAT